MIPDRGHTAKANCPKAGSNLIDAQSRNQSVEIVHDCGVARGLDILADGLRQRSRTFRFANAFVVSDIEQTILIREPDLNPRRIDAYDPALAVEKRENNLGTFWNLDLCTSLFIG